MPSISVVIPTYNRADHLRRAVTSVLNQTLQDFEILIMDDGSTDHTREAVESFADIRIKYGWAENAGGPAGPRNRGLKIAQGEYIAFLDSDDWWLPGKLEESLRYLEQGADIVYHDLFLVKKSNQKCLLAKTRARAVKNPVFNDLMAGGNALPNSSVVVRKELLTAINGFSEDRNLVACEDYDAWLRISKITERFRRISKTLGYYWAGGGNISNPNRLLVNMDALEQRHAGAFFNLNKEGCLSSFHYARGRAQYCLRSYEMAEQSLRLIRWSRAPFPLWLRSSLLRMLIGLRRFGG